MSIALAGISHHTSPIALRERLAIDSGLAPAAYARLRRDFPAGAVVLSTCNRVELYCCGEAPPAELQAGLVHALSDMRAVAREELEPALYRQDGRDAVRHLFRVAASLDSMVVGEAEILGQVQEAFALAQAHESSGKVLNALFQRAFKVAKEVRTNTAIGQGRVSVPSVAVELAVSIFGDLRGKTALVIGSGAMGEQTLRSLVEKGVGRVLISNRSSEKARVLAEEFRGEPLPFTMLGQMLYRADIIVSTTGAPETILQAADFSRALKQRQSAPIFAIDIAVPRDIDAAAGKLDNVYLYDIDDLQGIANRNIEARRGEIAASMEIIERHTDQFMEWLNSLAAQPAIVAMNNELEAMRAREVAKTLAAMPELSPEQREEIEYLSKRLMRNFLQRPMVALRKEAATGETAPVLHLVKRLFGLEEHA